MSHDPRDDYDDQADRGSPVAVWLVEGPASAMRMMGILQLLLVQTALLVFEITELRRAPPHQASDAEVWGCRIAWLFLTAVNIVIIVGAIRFKQFRSFSFVCCAAAFTAISLPFCIFAIVGIPIAATALSLLARRDVRARFEANARAASQRDLNRPSDVS